MSIQLLHGDCRTVLNTLPAESVHAVVTDPPYELGFMGKSWDTSGVSFDPETWRAVYRVLKPGGHLLAFGGTRTFHRIAVAVEDAGFEIRDSLAWLYGSGMPKGLNISKAFDKKAGAQREVVATGSSGKTRSILNAANYPESFGGEYAITVPATDLAKQWDGWNTALKPAFEPIIVGRKPFKGAVIDNVLAHGTGAINVDACRIPTNDIDYFLTDDRPSAHPQGHVYGLSRYESRAIRSGGHDLGRYPANVVLDEYTAALVDEQSGERPGCKSPSSAHSESIYRPHQGSYQRQGPIYGDTGGASRFFYCAKASASERNAGMPDGMKNDHPTVKPVSLMRWLVRLVTPPGGVVLDPFCGSGTTGVAAKDEGFSFIGIDADAHAIEIARHRCGVP